MLLRIFYIFFIALFLTTTPKFSGVNLYERSNGEALANTSDADGGESGKPTKVTLRQINLMSETDLFVMARSHDIYQFGDYKNSSSLAKSLMIHLNQNRRAILSLIRKANAIKDEKARKAFLQAEYERSERKLKLLAQDLDRARANFRKKADKNPLYQGNRAAITLGLFLFGDDFLENKMGYNNIDDDPDYLALLEARKQYRKQDKLADFIASWLSSPNVVIR